ncbi:coilin isoform X1 [Narcine bancroftii]|uniref:coilin isoform X1 n=1 Tax=Narcine bancroftii TaxID=1343680 RepID=UPI003831F7F0
MAAVRLRLAFEYPPPLQPAARLCWLLLPADTCRVVADLESIIRRRFGFGRHTRLHLYLHGGLLPPNESVLLVRDNDWLRVKQEELTAESSEEPVAGPPLGSRKRNRLQLEDAQPGQSDSRQRKKRRKVWLSEEQTPDTTEDSVSNAYTERSRKRKKKAEADGKYSVKKKHSKKKKVKCSKEQESGQASRSRPTLNLTCQRGQSQDIAGKQMVVSNSEHLPNEGSNGGLSGSVLAVAGSVGTEGAVLADTAGTGTGNGSDQSSSDSEQTPIGQDPSLKLDSHSTPSANGIIPNPNGSSADSSGCRSGQPEGGDWAAGRQWPPGAGRGRGRGFAAYAQGGDWQRRRPFLGRGRGTGPPHNGCPSSQLPRPGDWAATGEQHGATEDIPDVPKRDYSRLPLLAAPPQVGQRIAFKVLELSDNYTPELSDYKEGRILSYDATNQQVELHVESMSPECSKEPGKFDLIYKSENGEDVVEYAVTREPQLTQPWSSLVEPRLIVNPADLELAC